MSYPERTEPSTAQLGKRYILKTCHKMNGSVFVVDTVVKVSLAACAASVVLFPHCTLLNFIDIGEVQSG
jgi:hypothetical protein